MIQQNNNSIRNNQRSLSGNTLLEVLVSLTLISIVFLMSVQLFERFTGVYSPTQQFRNRALLDSYLDQPFETEKSYTEEVLLQGRSLKKNIKVLDRAKGLILIEGYCYYGEHLLVTKSKIIQIQDR